jgi:hypothetical protein
VTARYVHVATDHSVALDDALLVYDELGANQWHAADGDPTDACVFYAVAVDATGNVYVTGTKYTETTHKYSPAGAKLWSASYDAAADGYAVAVGPDGHVLVGGWWATYSCALLNGTTGAVIWRVDTGSDINAVARDADNVCYVGGKRVGGTTSIWTYAADGTPGWTADFGATVWAMAVDWTGAYLYVTGHHNSLACVRKYNAATGAEISTGGFPLEYDPAHFIGDTSAICVDRIGNIYLAHNSSVDDMQIRKFNSAGVQQWAQTWVTAYAALGIAVTPEGNVYVVGGSRGDGSAWIKRFDAVTGAEETGAGWPIEVGAYGVAVSPGVVGAFPSSWLPTGGGYPGGPGDWPTDADGGNDHDDDGVEDGDDWHDGGGGFPGAPPHIYVGRVDFE